MMDFSKLSGPIVKGSFNTINYDSYKFGHQKPVNNYTDTNLYPEDEHKNYIFSIEQINNYPYNLIKTVTDNTGFYGNKTYDFSNHGKCQNSLSYLSLNNYNQIMKYKKCQPTPYSNNNLTSYLPQNITTNELTDDNINTLNDLYGSIDYKLDTNNNTNHIKAIINTNNSKNPKYKIRINKEKIDFNNIEKEINEEKEIKETNQNENTIKKIKKNSIDISAHRSKHNEKKYSRINFNEDELTNKKRNNKNMFSEMKKDGNNKLFQEVREEDDDISKDLSSGNVAKINQNGGISNEGYRNINFIKYLKQGNEKLINANIIYKQLIDSFFYFINQLSKKYSFNKGIKPIAYYISNANELSNLLIDLEQHLNRVILSYKKENKPQQKDLRKDKDKEGDIGSEGELVGKSKFINMNTYKKSEQIIKKRNKWTNQMKEFLTQQNNKVYIKNNNNSLNKTLTNNSINCSHSNNKEIIKNKNVLSTINNNNKNDNNSIKLIRVMKRINLGLYTPHTPHNNRISNKRNIRNLKLMNNNNK